MRHIEQILDTKQLRRMRSESKAIDRLEQQELAAKYYIGELCRDGRTVYYVNLPKYREGSYSTLVAYLARVNLI